MFQQSLEPRSIEDYYLADFCKFRELSDSGEHYVGVKFDDSKEHPIIHLPLGCPEPSTVSTLELRKIISMLIRVIIKVKRELNKGLDDKRGENSIQFPFDAYRRLILDYVNFGFIRESERNETTSGSGRIDWSKTLRKSQPLWTTSGPVYLSPIRINTIYSHQDIMQIQSYCLKLADFHIGWLYGRKKPILRQWSSAKLFWARNKIELFKRQTFDSRISKLLRSMQIILSNQVDDSRNIEGYYNIGIQGNTAVGDMWEKMVEGVFGSGKHGQYSPQAIYTYANQSSSAAAGSMELDSIRFDGSICTVIDAKYYGERLPATSDINKQITYGEWVAKKLEGEDLQVQNLFMLPGEVLGPHHEYIGYATMDILEDKSKPYHKVHLKRIDFCQLMKMYLQNDKSKSKEFCHIPVD